MPKWPGSKSSIPSSVLCAPTTPRGASIRRIPVPPETTRSQKAARSGAPGTRTAMPTIAIGSPGSGSPSVPGAEGGRGRGAVRWRARERTVTCSKRSATLKRIPRTVVQRRWKRISARLEAPASKNVWSGAIVAPATSSKAAVSRSSIADSPVRATAERRISSPGARSAARRSSLPLGVRGSARSLRNRSMRT